MTTKTLTLASVVGLMMLGGAAAVPASAARQPDQREPGGEATDDAAALRQRLERAIERGEAMLERQREALERLEAGESPGEVLRSLRWREFARDSEQRDASTQVQPPARRRGRVEAAREVSVSPRASEPGGRWDDVGADGRRRLRAFLRENLPSVDQQLAQVEAMDAETGARLFDRLIPQLREVAADTERDPALGALRLEEMRAGLAVVDATQRVRSLASDAPAEERQAAEDALRAAIAARFDARIRMREHELERLAARIAELHDQIKSEQASRDDEIARIYRTVTSQRWARPAPERRDDRGSEEQPDQP